MYFRIQFFADFTVRKGKTYVGGIMIITDRFLIYVEDFKNVRYLCRLDHITNCEVYQEDYSLSI